jgi:aminopeptidase
MRDPRIDKLADLLVNYSVKVQPKQKVLIHGELGSEPLLSACFKKCLQAGAYPFAVPYISDWTESTLRYGNLDQYAAVYQPFREMYETYDARIRIMGDLNTKELSQFDPAKVSNSSASTATH